MAGGSAAALALLRSFSPAEAAAIDAAPRPFASPPPRPLLAARRRRALASLLVTGCGRSGTHALAALLRRHGVRAQHEGRGADATVGWPYAGRVAGSWRALWPMAAQPSSFEAYEPIFKLHRHPLAAVGAVAAGLTTSGRCRNPSERRWDARAWRCASAFVDLPVAAVAVSRGGTCDLPAEARLRLALHYWVKWNLLADRWAARGFAVESLSVAQFAREWCDHCEKAATCGCPPAALAAARNSTEEKVRARRHGRKRPPIEWSTLDRLDRNMSAVAQRMALAYGYALVVPS
ncbi:hypothetical protein AB1Y20_014832 [Prymnesium parvum]|uniref:Sulfotransferase n=1 Tax=Prymnesium parvum TaxID=97485 RepID=A0AB34JYU9_PRYPA